MSRLRRFVDSVRGTGGRAWAGSVDDLLYDGESVRERLELGEDNRVVVTSHRLLAFTPDGDGENYRAVELPNVADVRAGHEGEDNLIRHGGRLGIYGAVLLAVGVFVDFGSFVPTDAFAGAGAGQLGMGGLLAMLQRFLSLIARTDEFARTIGALLVLFAVFVFGVYLLTRDRVLEVGVAGDADPIRVPADDETIDGAVADLEVVLFGTAETGGANDASVRDTPTSDGDPRTGDGDPLAGDSGAVRSGGIAGGAGSSEREASEVDRAVRETGRADFSEEVDEVMGTGERETSE
ncbi:hypothetical protein HZS55_21045 [Halosimplex rubrum]|uniref:Uncharacterized protein n=1 Tax=Halosimplex rubrum TaxID=869889 RepID=A0A7D5T287_9EURY|nr:hypothetical protein [Halosimplex rubrum]QLH79628.1 hypothetical protein HZS55_21045 [Halosimplex rubrum]